jgi:hypothetical protein
MHVDEFFDSEDESGNYDSETEYWKEESEDDEEIEYY